MSYFIACIRYTWLGCKYPNYHASTFFLDQGTTMCRGCGTGVSREGWAQHVHGKNKAKQTNHALKLLVRNCAQLGARCAHILNKSLVIRFA
jgi:hypothetical protein